jgi:hypothetical protein
MPRRRETGGVWRPVRIAGASAFLDDEKTARLAAAAAVAVLLW